MHRGLLLGILMSSATCQTVSDAANDHHGAGAAPRTNRLAREVSPYLLLHAHNPVDWYPWGPEALERARSLDRPIFLSVGYSTCYWCHVMEREIFSDPETAALMNEWFVNIKVDREERPDLDLIYMTATQLLAGRGGWPNSVFLTPDLQPFFAGSYFPPEPRHGLPGFPQVIEGLHQAWVERREEVEETAARLTEAMRQVHAEELSPLAEADTAVVTRALDEMKAAYDGTYGGFGGPPKFAPSMRLELLMDLHERTGDQEALDMVTHTLEVMARGGVYDQIGGGFHRYATDARWRIPHFEKMLYNQAHLARIYTRAYAMTQEARWQRVTDDIVAYVLREMTSPEGGFYSALDAETEGEEGRYYFWTQREIARVLGEGAAVFAAVYGLAPMPEGEGAEAEAADRACVVYATDSLEGAASRLGIGSAELNSRLDSIRYRLLQVRQARPRPLLDDKILTAWNGMMIAALADAHTALGRPEYLQAGARAARFVLDKMRRPGGELARAYRQGETRYAGYLEDYAYLLDGLLALHRASGEVEWLEASQRVADEMVVRFWDEAAGGFFYSDGGADLIVRSKSGQDSALPSANGVAAAGLFELGLRTGQGVSAAAPHTPADSLVGVRFDLPRTRLVPGEWLPLTVHVEIAEGWHVNANPAAAEWLVPTSLTMNTDLPVSMSRVEYPISLDLPFPALGETLKVYSGSLRLRARLEADEGMPGASGTVRFALQYQACDEGHCLPPSTVTETIQLQVTGSAAE